MTVVAGGTDRLPLPADEDLTPEQRAAVSEITAGPRGVLNGPFIPLLRAPELMTRLQRVGEYLRFSSELDDDVFELAILVVARFWDQPFEWGFHHPLALAAGLPRDVVDDVAAGRAPAGGRPEVQAASRVVSSLLADGGVDDEAYTAAVGLLGDTALVELVATVGYYTTLALTMNAARTPPPPGAPVLPARDQGASS